MFASYYYPRVLSVLCHAISIILHASQSFHSFYILFFCLMELLMRSFASFLPVVYCCAASKGLNLDHENIVCFSLDSVCASDDDVGDT